MLALLASVQFKSALRTLSDCLAQIFKQSATLRTTGDGSRSRHIQRPGTERIILFRRGCRLLKLLLRVAAGVLVSPLPVFAIGQTTLLERLIVRLCRPLHKAYFHFRRGNRLSRLIIYLQGGRMATPVALQTTMNCLSQIPVLTSEQNRIYRGGSYGGS